MDFVESGVVTGDEVIAVAHEYLDPLLDEGIDTLVLGCTHYPLLTGVISYVCGDDVTLVSSAEETAKDVYRTLAAHQLGRPADSPAAGAPVPGHRRPPAVRPARPPVPRPGGHHGRADPGVGHRRLNGLAIPAPGMRPWGP